MLTKHCVNRLMRVPVTRLLLLTAFVLSLIAPAAAQDSAFPVTIEHKYGSTTITEEPRRVVSLGYTDQDPLLALGIKPLAVRYWYGDEADAIFPWAEDEAEGTQPAVFNMPTLNYEAILALNPDLIIAIYSGITEDDYKALSQIAPTVAQLAEYTDYGMPWQETTRLVGAAAGKSDQAETLISDTEALITNAREQNPAFAGKSIAVVYAYQAGSYGYYTAQDPRGRFFTDLGFVIPEDLLEIAGDSYYADLSPERVDLLDRDLIVVVGLQFVAGGREEIESDPLLSQLNAVKEGRILYVPGDVDDALQFNTVLSLPYLLEHLLPELQAVVGTETPVATEAASICEAGFRLFDDELLATDPICIPEQPQRIAAVDTFTLETLLALGIKPVSGPFLETFLRDHPEFTDELEGVIDTAYPVNAEALVKANPDLIISIEPWISETIGEIAQIAPTVSIQYPGDGAWQDIVHAIGAAVNQSKAIDAAFEAYAARLQTFQDTIADSSVGDVAIVFLLPDQLAPFLSDTFSGAVLLETGLTFPPALIEAAGEGPLTDISQERLDLIASSDHIFVVTSGFTEQDLADYQQLIAALESNPLWQSLPAVQAGHVHIVGRDWLGSSLIAAHVVLDDLFTAIADVDPAEVSPDPFLSHETPPEVTAEATEAP